MQSPRPDAGHLAGKRAAHLIAAEFRSDVFGAYRAHARADFPAYGCIPKADVINLCC